jgi:NAD(P)-dependent dehydrogenase (short-subunit alcohol dehydrogenase family)
MKRPSRNSLVAVISGATGGIGGAIFRRMRDAGYRLSLGARDPGKLASEEGPRVKAFRYDAACVADAQGWVDATLAHFGRIDVLVNSAGILREVTLEQGTEDDLDALLGINVKAPFRLIQAAFPALAVSGCGRVINIASLSGKRVRNLNAGYQMSKFAVVALTHAVRRAGWDRGIRATAVCPGWVGTAMADNKSPMPSEQITDADELADLVVSIIGLSNTASVAELLVNCAYETTL